MDAAQPRNLCRRRIARAGAHCIGVAPRSLCLLVWFVAWGVSFYLEAAPPTTPTTDVANDVPLVPYRLIYAPLDEIAKRSHGEYRTMARAAFDRALADWQSQLPVAFRRGALLEHAIYVAHLEDQHLVGNLNWRITQIDAEPTWLRLGRMPLALRDPHWIDEPQGAPSVEIGCQPTGDWLLHVPRAGTLQARWSLGLLRRDEDRLVYRAELPACPRNELELQIPTMYDLQVTPGVARRIQLQEDAVAIVSGSPSASAVDLWHIDLGGHTAWELTLTRRDSRPPRAGLRQDARYVLSEAGVTLASELQFDCDQSPLHRIELRIDAPLRLIRAQTATQSLDWTVRPDSDGVELLTVNLPQPLRGLRQIVRVEAVAPPLPERMSSLPRVRVENVDWLQEMQRLTVQTPLTVHDFDVVNALRSVSSLTTNVDETPTMMIRFLDPSARVALRLASERPQMTIDQVNTLRVDVEESISQVAIDVGNVEYDPFELQARVADGWTVESLESEDAGLIDTWQVSELANGVRQLQIRLRKPLAKDQWTRLQLQARRTVRFDAQAHELGQLQPVMFDGAAHDSRQFLVIETADGIGSQITDNGEVTWVRANQLDARELRLIGNHSSDRVLLVDATTRRQSVRFAQRPETTRIASAKMELDAQLTARTCREHWRIQLEGSERPPRIVRVQLSQASSADVRWYLESAPSRDLAARRLANDLQGEVWEIDWPEPTRGPWVLHGERSTPIADDGAQLALLRVEEADSQEGTLVMDTTYDWSMHVDASPLLTPLPLGRTSFRESATDRHAYRYAPLAESLFRPEGTLRVHVTPRVREEWPLIAWRMRSDLFVDETAVRRERMAWWLENLGADRLRLRVPTNSIVRQIYVNDRPATHDFDTKDVVSVTLPTNDRFPRVVVEWETTEGGTRGVRKVSPHAAGLDVPVLNREYYVWAAPALQLFYSSDSIVTAQRKWHAADSLLGHHDWLANAFGGDALVSRSFAWVQSDVRAWLERLGGQDVQRWSDLFATKTSDANASKSVAIWIDDQALAEIGIGPTTLLPPGRGNDAWTRALERLRRSRVVVVQATDGCVVTSMQRVAQQLAQTSDANVENVLQSHVAIADDVKTTDRRAAFADRGLIPSNAWLSTERTWTDPRPDVVPYVAAGWRVVELVEGRHAWCWRRSSVQLVWWALAAMTFAATTWVLPHLRVGRHLVLVGLWVAAVVATGSWPLVSLWGGAVLCGGWLAIGAALWRHRSRPAVSLTRPLESSSGSHGSWRRVAGTTIALLGLGFLSPQRCYGQPPVESRRPEPSQGADEFDVFVPADDRGIPTGDFVLIPRAMQDLLRWGHDPAMSSRATTLLLDLNLRGALLRRDNSAQLELPTVTAQLNVQVPIGSDQIVLPLPAHVAAAIEPVIRVDGRVQRWRWDDLGKVWIIARIPAGRHQVEWTYRPQLRRERGVASVSIPLVPAPSTSLLLDAPIDATSLVIPEAHGAVSRNETSGEWQVDLGPCDQVTLQWPTEEPSEGPAIEELSWMHLSADRVQLDVQLRIDRRLWKDAVVAIDLDERLQLDLTHSPQPQSLSTTDMPGVRRMEFALQDTNLEIVRVPLRFLVEGVAGVGHIPAPYFQVRGAKVSRWLAVSADDPMTLRVEPGNASSLATTAFVQRWGGTTTPQYAYQFATLPKGWLCHGQLSPLKPQVDVQSAYVLSQTATQIWIAATVRTNTTPCFQQRIQLPEDMEVRSVQRLSSGGGSTLRWSRNAPDQLTIFMEPAQVGTFQLGIAGQQAGQPLGTRRLPAIRWLDASVSSDLRSIFRQADVILPDAGLPSTAATPALASDLAPFLRNQLTLARSWTQWLETDPSAPRDVEVRANPRKLRAATQYLVTRHQGAWQLRFEIQPRLEAGVLDGLTVEIPDAWTTGLQDEIDARIIMRPSPHAGMVRITIWPPSQPINPALPIVLSGPISMRAGEPLSIPPLRLLEEGLTERRLFLPSQVDGQPVLWNLAGVEPLPTDIELPESLPASDGYRAYRIIDDTFTATRLPTQAAVGQPVVSLAESIHVGRGTTPSEQSVIWDLIPDGLTSVWLELPSDAKPWLLTLEERPRSLADLEQHVDGPVTRYRVPLDSPTLPQRLRLVMRGPALSRRSASIEWGLPKLYHQHGLTRQDVTPIPVQQVAWRLFDRASEGAMAWNSVTVPSQSDAARSAQRLDVLADLFERASQQASDFAPADLARWYAVWGERFFAALRDERIRVQQLPVDARMAGEADLARRLEEHLARATALKVERDYQRLVGQAEVADTPQIIVDALQRTTPVWQGTTNAPIDRVAVQRTFASFQPMGRWWSALGLCVLTAALIYTPWLTRLWSTAPPETMQTPTTSIDSD